MPFATLRALYHEEFHAYRIADFSRDALAGLTVAAVSLPLALAFGENGVDRQRALAASAQSRDHSQPVVRDIEVDSAEVMGSHIPQPDE